MALSNSWVQLRRTPTELRPLAQWPRHPKNRAFGHVPAPASTLTMPVLACSVSPRSPLQLSERDAYGCLGARYPGFARTLHCM
eukprot:scaffold3123_cov119-Cylindrotheca_fusiformis.AAC.2